MIWSYQEQHTLWMCLCLKSNREGLVWGIFSRGVIVDILYLILRRECMALLLILLSIHEIYKIYLSKVFSAD